MELLIPYALKGGRIVHIDEVERGEACNCICPACHGVLVARKGEERAHCFAHKSIGHCEFSAETTLHKLAKQIIASAQIINTPALNYVVNIPFPFYPFNEIEIGGEQFGVASRPIHSVELEKVFGSIRPDAYIHSEPFDFAIEVAVTKKVHGDKNRSIRIHNLATLEIELQKNDITKSQEEIRNLVLVEQFNKKWIYHPQFLAVEKQARKREAELAQLAAEEAQRQENERLAEIEKHKQRESAEAQKRAQQLDAQIDISHPWGKSLESPPANDFLGALIAPLNPAQKEAVTAPTEHRLVLAGAGSGKTRVLVHRIAWLIAREGVSPLSILAVTFTNKAAAEMRGRIEQLVSIPVRAMWVGTFHGTAHRMLRMHWKEARLPQNFQILDADDQVRLVKRVLRALELPEDKWQPKQVAGFINGQKEEGRRPQHLQDLGDPTQRTLVRAYAAYQEQCERNGLVDFAELLLRAYELCRDNADIQRHYRQRFRHILVDEFQDTNRLQYEWLRVLAGHTGTLFAVGDDDQSIYSWRGARVENMMKLDRDFPGTQIIKLEQNYRSTGTILKAANGLIARNSARLGKELWTDGNEGEAIQLYAAYNEYDEAEFVVNRMREHLDGRARHSDLAVLYRMGAQSRVLEETLIKARIPYRIYGGLRFFERMEVKDALAYLRLLHNRDDDTSFERAVNTPPRGIGATTIEKLREIARSQNVSLWTAANSGAQTLGRSANAVGAFLALIEQMFADTRGLTLSEATGRVIERSGLREHYKKERGEQAEARLENLDELISAARGFEELPPAGEGEPTLEPLTAFLTHASLEAGDEQAGPGEDCVQLMTLHAAKGLEFPVVFMVGMENGLFPSQRTMDEGNLEEERRLCYVGITRARERLYLSYAEMRRLHGVEQINLPSMFLKEIPADCVDETRPRAGILRPAFAPRPQASSWRDGAYNSGSYASSAFGGGSYNKDGYPARSAAAAPKLSDTGPGGYKLGQRVSHARFGEGTILSFDGDGDRAQVEIRFKAHGTKRLMLGYANLTPL
ncbi:MAG: DNA helicase II [Nevskiaceae bacterium]|nr:MAG: DNA helicase II [Nevskiaceae bacterium]